jgi:hypothetical protein
MRMIARGTKAGVDELKEARILPSFEATGFRLAMPLNWRLGAVGKEKKKASRADQFGMQFFTDQITKCYHYYWRPHLCRVQKFSPRLFRRALDE